MGIWEKLRRKFRVRRSTKDILGDLRTLDRSEEGFDKQRYESLMSEWRKSFQNDQMVLSSLKALPFRVKHKWSDADLSDMAAEVETLKICAKITVWELCERGRSQSTSDFFATMKYQADAYRLFGFDECDFPYSFMVDSDLVAEAIIKACKENGESRDDIIAKFTSGFDEFAGLIRRPVMKKMGILDRRSFSFARFQHPRIVGVSMQKFRDGYYADAVESAFKELNNAVKEKVKSRLDKELDGVPLMQHAFSPVNPILLVENDLDTRTNKDTQQGYMMMFAGAVGAIRNPKAHENMVISRDDAIRKLIFASMLMYKLDTSHFAVEQK